MATSTAATRSARPSPRGGSASSGITLLELLLVLSILGILVTLALPGFVGGTGSHRVVRESRKVHAALAHARARAVAEQRPHRFVLLADGRYRLEALTDGAGWVAYQTSAAPSDPVRVIGGSGGGAVVFEPDGRVETPATVRVGAPPSRHEIRILAGGLVRWAGPSS